MLAIEPPVDSVGLLEEKRTKVYSCRYCGGRGFLSSLYDEDDVPCPVCDGEGEIVGVIKINWKPRSESHE